MRLILFCSLLLLTNCIDLKTNQTLNVFFVDSPTNQSSCEFSTSWVSGASGQPDSILFTPLKSTCLFPEARLCQIQTLSEFLVHDPDSVKVVDFWAQYIPNLEEYIVPLKCPVENQDTVHILFYNGFYGQTLEVMVGKEAPHILATNVSDTVYVESLKIKGTVPHAVSVPGDTCSTSDLRGGIHFGNQKPFQNAPWVGTMAVALGDVVIFGKDYLSQTFQCYYEWVGAVQLGTSCTNTEGVPSDIKVDFSALELGNGYVVFGLEALNSTSNYSNKCTFIFRLRE